MLFYWFKVTQSTKKRNSKPIRDTLVNLNKLASVTLLLSTSCYFYAILGGSYLRIFCLFTKLFHRCKYTYVICFIKLKFSLSFWAVNQFLPVSYQQHCQSVPTSVPLQDNIDCLATEYFCQSFPD